jgi:hypothetical protein
MANKTEVNHDLHDIAGGWITERKHTEVPTFLRFAYIVIGLFAVSYLVLYVFGETAHPERGSLVEQFNRATETSPGLMCGVAALVALFFLSVITFAFRNTEGGE